MEEILRQIPGVLETEAGYSGGTLENATYEDVKNHFILRQLDLIKLFVRLPVPRAPEARGARRVGLEDPGLLPGAAQGPPQL
mgnify:CR=1 FL=1